MPLEVKRKPRESVQSLIRRFSQKVRRSGILIQARKIRFREEPRSKQAKKKTALKKQQLRQEYERLKKLGK